MDDELAGALTEHYQKSYEVAHELWLERNRIFLLLLASVAAATLLTFSPESGRPLLLALLGKLLSVGDPESLRKSISFVVMQGIIMIVVFYFMLNLYHAAYEVIRHYNYLEAMEKEIRAHLRLELCAVAFTRQSTFYWSYRPPLWSFVRWTYISLLGGLLGTFIAGRFVYDFRAGVLFPMLVDTAISFATLCYFAAYVLVTTRNDKRTKAVG